MGFQEGFCSLELVYPILSVSFRSDKVHLGCHEFLWFS